MEQVNLIHTKYVTIPCTSPQQTCTVHYFQLPFVAFPNWSQTHTSYLNSYLTYINHYIIQNRSQNKFLTLFQHLVQTFHRKRHTCMRTTYLGLWHHLNPLGINLTTAHKLYVHPFRNSDGLIFGFCPGITAYGDHATQKTGTS